MIYKFSLIVQVHEFKVEMTCEGCSGAVERVLGKLKGKWVIKLDKKYIFSSCESV